MSLPYGLYETLVSEALAGRLAALPGDRRAVTEELRAAEAADRIAWHIASLVERAIEEYPEEERAAAGARIARLLIERLIEETQLRKFLADLLREPPSVLRAIQRLRPDGSPAGVEPPLTPLLDSAILTSSRGEPRLVHEIGAEIASADRIDIIMAFIRRSGVRLYLDRLRRHVENGGRIRVLTTAYTGTTEAAALDMLRDAGAEIRVSYDTGSTRLHAKAWLFHRESGFSTAYVGSSNLTHAAQVPGLEWNVRIAGARNPSIIAKIAAVFESCWESPAFQPYDGGRFARFVGRVRPDAGPVLLSPTEVTPYPFQERLLEQIELSRALGHHRNLLVAATGTGKTVMAALDYARLRRRLLRARLLFVAHREEILEQSRATFAHVLRDASFGELWVGGRRPERYDHVFASIQSLNAHGVESIPPDHFDVVIIDEFHHAAAASYRRLLNHLEPQELLGLTATPERSDGLPVLHWFGDRIAAELRLWDAIDQQCLVPFAYYGITDELDLRDIPFRRGRGYDERALTNVITGSDIWARYVLKRFLDHFGNPPEVRALGFCVGVDHARYMARVFREHGVPAVAVTGNTPEDERRRALRELERGDVRVVFSVDLFNEGVDVPSVDALLMLRPTESPVLYIQQLGRGLRKAPDKAICTVLDFVGNHNREFRYDRRFRALLGGSRRDIERQIEEGFPFLPAGCHMELDPVARERVLASIRNALPRTVDERARELAELVRRKGDVTLREFLEETGLELEDVYGGNRSWSGLRERAGLEMLPGGPHEQTLRAACGRLLHVDDLERLRTWRRWLQSDAPPVVGASERDDRLLRMLLGQLLYSVQGSGISLEAGARLLWGHPQVRRELVDLFEVLERRVTHLAPPLDSLPDVPLRVHARYTRVEILAGCGEGQGARVPKWQTGVWYVASLPADLLAFTLDKSRGGFSPTTRYRDYAISPELIHWESQSVTRADSETGRRYRDHERLGSHILLFARLNTDQRAFYFLGPATYVRHEGERPMAITWKLRHRLPGDLFQEFAAAVA